MSKFSHEVLQRCIFPYVKNQDPGVILGAAFGQDVALTKVGGDILASHVDPIVGAIENIGWLAVHIACNDIAASGIRPSWALVLVLVPRVEDEDMLEEIMQDASRAAQEAGISIIGGHTGYSSGVVRPLVAVTALGNAAGRTPIYTGGAHLEDHVLITKGVALEGTAILAHDFADVAKKLGITDAELDQARNLAHEVSVIPESDVLAEHGATSMHDVTRGGLMETLIEMANASGMCFRINSSLVPARPVIDRFAERFGFDPLRMISSGSLAATVSPDRVDAVIRELSERGIPCADIGRVTEGKGIIVEGSGTVDHYTEIRCEDDELARMWTLYPR